MPYNPPYRKYIIGSLLRGRDANRISRCLRSIELVHELPPELITELSTEELVKDIHEYQNAECLEDKIAVADRHGVSLFMGSMEENNEAWKECWDLISVKKYREFILVLASIPTFDAIGIKDAFNRKFSRSVTKAGVELLIESFWDLKKRTTTDIKTAVDGMVSRTLSTGIKKLLFGNPVSAAKSVGVSLKLNYALILEEMLADAYLKYREAVEGRSSSEEIRAAANSIIRIGDRVDKMSKKDADADVLHNLLTELKISTQDTGFTLDKFREDAEVI